MAETGHALFDDERGDAARPGCRIGFGVDHQHVGIAAIGDPHLAAVEDETVACRFGAQLHADHVAAGIGLGHGQCADTGTGDQAGQVAGFLGGSAMAADLVDTQVGMGAVGECHRSRGPADLFHGDNMGQIAHAAAAVGLVHGDAEQSHVAEPGPQVGRKLVGTVNVGSTGGDFGFGKGPDCVAQGSKVFAQQVWQRVHAMSPRWKSRSGGDCWISC